MENLLRSGGSLFEKSNGRTIRSAPRRRRGMGGSTMGMSDSPAPTHRERFSPLSFRGLVLAALATLIAVAAGGGITQQGSAAADLQDGDFLVGVSVDQGFGGTEGRILRVRDGVATEFCGPVTGNRDQPGFWNTPNDVLIDSQGRVVFLALLDGVFGVPVRGFGLWRCDSMGATPTILGAFGSDPLTQLPQASRRPAGPLGHGPSPEAQPGSGPEQPHDDRVRSSTSSLSLMSTANTCLRTLWPTTLRRGNGSSRFKIPSKRIRALLGTQARST